MNDKISKYSIELECFNCWKSQDYFIPKGQYIPHNFPASECDNCGCNSMRRQR